jgi:hypothetical protein
VRAPRYWITEMHADRFWFDLAPTLARQDGAFDKVSAFLDMCSQDPVVCQAKLVDEPSRVRLSSQPPRPWSETATLISRRGPARRITPGRVKATPPRRTTWPGKAATRHAPSRAASA